jgi:hypothetical protein
MVAAQENDAMERSTTMTYARYVEVCRRYRELRDECESLKARSITGAELVAAVESKCRRLGQLVSALAKRAQ